MAVQPLKIGIALIGPGAIGSTFLEQLSSQRSKLIDRYNLDARVLGIAGSRKMYINPKGIDLVQWKSLYNTQSIKADLEAFFTQIHTSKDFRHHVFVDNTASDEVPNHYSRWLSTKCHIVTPNKRLGSGSLQRYRQVQQSCKNYESQFLYEATVGAGLPVISTLQGLLDTGDEIQRIEGVFSGTLSFIFNQVSQEQSFSDVVNKAKASGFTEPDPRDDLSGMDVARKVVVLARECGCEIELDDLQIESLVPQDLQSISSADDFLNELPKYDDSMLSKIVEAEKEHAVLRYVGIVDPKEKKFEVALRQYPKTHAFGSLDGTDNMVIFKTARYNQQPLVIRGPGAGAEVTAMGVFSDFITIAKRLKH